MFCSKFIPSHAIFSKFDQILLNFRYIFGRFHNVIKGEHWQHIFNSECLFYSFLIENDHVFIQGLNNNIF